jgi:uncharacterized protein (DUF924 family)
MFEFFLKEAMQLWFGKSLATDLEVKTRFGHLVEAAFRYSIRQGALVGSPILK